MSRLRRDTAAQKVASIIRQHFSTVAASRRPFAAANKFNLSSINGEIFSPDEGAL
jgi:hypothetical protein